MTEPHSPEILERVRPHFNEPMLLMLEVVRCVGYAEDADDCYIIVRQNGDREAWTTIVGGWVFLDAIPKDDLERLDNLLTRHGVLKAETFNVKIEHEWSK